MPSTLKERLEQAVRESDPAPSKADIARAAKVKPPSVSDWFSGKTMSLGKSLLPLSEFLRVNPQWLSTGRGPMRSASNASQPAYRVQEAGAQYDSGHEIELIDAHGSCGGGSIVWEMEDRAPLVKESAWFRRYAVRPEDVFAIFAHGDSMADFIVDGDIVIFNSTKTTPKSGQIFLIEHPDGLKIKRMRMSIDGSWFLESLNADKARFPDEIITSDQTDLLKVKGQFVYRQGG